MTWRGGYVGMMWWLSFLHGGVVIPASFWNMDPAEAAARSAIGRTGDEITLDEVERITI